MYIKFYNTLTDSAEDLDVVIPMYNLLEYRNNYSMTSRRLSNYYRDEFDDVNDIAWQSKSLKYKTKLMGRTTVQP